MSTKVPNAAPFLRVQRLFPRDAQPLSVEIDRAYTDIASSVNARMIGIFSTNSPIQNGEFWYSDGIRYQGNRQLYFVTGTGNIVHNIDTTIINGFTRIYGTFTDGTIWYPLPYVNAVATNNQISLTVTTTNIVITAGGGAPPTVSSGFVVLEWISLV